MKLTSPAFKAGEKIPQKFTCEGRDVNPPLVIEHIPEGTQSLALIVDDPDAPGGWVHWILFNVSPKTTTIKEDSQPGDQGTNDFGRLDYGGPCPPSGKHTYYFRIYALGTTLNVGTGVKQDALERAMKGHILQQTELTGTYQKKS